MSTIAVDNVKPSAGGTSYSTRGIAKAWVNFNGTGVVAIRDSENTSSITDNGAGQYTVNFTNAHGGTTYGFLTCSRDNQNLGINSGVAPTVSALTVYNSATNTLTATDSIYAGVSTLGDLA